VNPPGPCHAHAVAFNELAESVAVPPTQIAPSLVAPVEDGTGFIDTVPTEEIEERDEVLQVVVHQ
jgi:hypothetical protein